MTSFTSSSIQMQTKFHKQPEGVEMLELFETLDNLTCKFGICEIITSQIETTEIQTGKPKHIHITIDNSGSMDDIGSDGKTKMEQVIFVLKNMLYTFNENKIQISLTIDTFSDKIIHIFKNEIVTDENIHHLLELVKKIRPDTGTNIELALNNAKILCDEDIGDTIEKVHLLLTDGDPTSGDCNLPVLVGLVSNKMSNVFIGFGLGHNAVLLSDMAKKYSDDYRFIDAVEKSGLVIGEVLSDIIHRIAKNVVITIENGLIYNYATNTWDETLYIGSLSIGKTRIFQIKSATPETVIIRINGFNMNQTNISTESTLIPSQDLTEYLFRQKVQSLIFSSLKIKLHDKLEKILKIKDEITSLYNTIKIFQTGTGEESGKGLLGILMDDLYVILNTVGKHNSYMYSNSRQLSQGRQTTYGVKTFDTPNPMKRQFNAFEFENDYDEEEEGDDGNKQPPLCLNHHQFTQDYDDEDETNSHTVKMMRCISDNKH